MNYRASIIKILSILFAIIFGFIINSNLSSETPKEPLNAKPLPSNNNQAELTLCSQNLFNYGLRDQRNRNSNKDRNNRQSEQRKFLVERFVNANCDIIALQEITGENIAISKALISNLSKSLSDKSQKKFSFFVSDSNDSRIRNGFIYNSQIVKIIEAKSFNGNRVEPLNLLASSRKHTRGPSLIRAIVSPSNGSDKKEFLIFSTHLKSKRDSWKDNSKTDWELIRMEHAYDLYKTALTEEGKKDAILVIMGDRNNTEDSASAKLISGELSLDDFRNKNCKLDSKNLPNCKKGNKISKLSPLFALRKKQDKNTYGGGSHRYKGESHLIDEIYLETDNLNLVKRSNDKFKIGLEGNFYRGSDHKLLWATLDW